MKVGYIADVHLGNHKQHGGRVEKSLNYRCRATLGVLEDVVVYCAGHSIDRLVVAGDLFDTENPLPQIQTEAINTLNQVRETHILLGNHENVSAQVGDHALGPMNTQQITTFVGPTWIPFVKENAAAEIYLPFRAEHPREWFEIELHRKAHAARQNGYNPRVAVAHFGIYDDSMVREAQFDITKLKALHVNEVRKAAELAEVPVVLSGDWHSRRVWQTTGKPIVAQIGALVPTGWDNPGFDGYGSLLVLDTETGRLEAVEIPGPRFINATSVDDVLDDIKVGSAWPGYSYYVRVTAPVAEATSIGTALSALAEDGSIKAFEVRPDRKLAEEKALKAAKTAGEQETLRAAMSVFIDEMPLAAKVDRQKVHAKCLELMQ